MRPDDRRTLRIVEALDAALIEQVRRLFRAYAEEFAGTIAESLCLQGFEAELEELPGRYAPPSGCLLMATDGTHALGCIAMRDLGEKTCEMKRLYVAPEGRGLGIGRRLVEAIMERARAAGYRRMVLDTLPEMTEAISLYQRAGFVETTAYCDNPIERTLYMEKSLSGSPPVVPGSIEEVVATDLAAYYRHLADRVERLARTLTHDELWSNPWNFGNSVGRIVIHLTGNLNHYIGALILGTGYERNRDAEFADTARPTVEELLADFRRAVDMVIEATQKQSEGDFLIGVENCGPPVRNRFGLFLVCLSHLNNHIGQMVYLVQAHGYAIDEKSW